ncbi:ATP-dependent DNA helicase RecG [Vampirovibrio chlorellavorus]|uniref:ATP-dependent DNA helicase RecG n=1 Tax=Vampirovibrio chlorellavorus TaxID=758823 RepID=UPI0026EBF8C1|nr:ATP-dependent DNA helicase RecG [Vampirovibrio chlorellavorus]
MLSLEEVQLKLKDLRQAVSIEKDHRYIDVQGRKKTFSRFVFDTLKEMPPLTLDDGSGADNPVDTLRRKFENYPFMDLGGRMRTLESMEQFLIALSRQGAAQRKAPKLSTEPPKAGGKSIHELEVKYLKGVGPKLAQLLGLVGIQTVENLLYYFPRRYLDYNNRVKILDLNQGDEVTVIGSIRSVNAYKTKNGLAILSLVITDDTGMMAANWFLGKLSQASLEAQKDRYPKGADVMLSGKVKWDTYKKIPAMDRPQLEILSYQDATGVQENDSLHAGRLVPIYALTEGLNLRFLRKAIHQALQDYLDSIIDPVPQSVLQQYGLMPLKQALRQIHFPETRELATAARERLVFDELFYVQLRLSLIRQQYKRTVKGLNLVYHPDGYAEQLKQALPFALTGAQQRVLNEISQDIASDEPMYRMLQGDVGSGKTVVAILTLLAAVENGYQGALMAPTEILAEQHYRKCVEWLTPLGLRAGLFVGKSGARERRELRQALLNGQIHVAVGTHALIQDDVEFAKLGIVVVDEQHRFGVRQRTLLKSKGQHPEMLTMTATPIPRSLAMTLHGDLDVSILDELPPGRTPIKTTLLTHSQLGQGYQLIRQEILKGRQAYIVFPLIEESETLSAKAATSEAERLQQEVFQDLRIGLLHGKMRPDEKDAVMSRFAAGDLHILVSTTVVEVGVDVPNATVMIIENADRFGLSQLHQLRGRVGRSSHQSYCVLVSDNKTETTLTRLSILTESEDGFYISERDLELRGPGEFLGTRQSGLPDFVLADLIEDKDTLEKARKAAFAIAADGEYLNQHPQLRDMVYQKTDDTFSTLGSG